jgi:hypothetical protein
MTVINLGNLKFTWKGDWAQTTAYNKDDIVKYGPSVYVCVDAHTSGSAFANNVAKFEVMAEGLESAGVWNQSTLYQKGQTVTFGGAVYVALQENQNKNPGTEPADWAKFVDGQQFEGDYDIVTTYQKGDIVYYGGYLYVAKQNSLNNDPTNTIFWDVYSKGYENTGAWGNATQYKPGDVVNFGGNQYVVKEGQRPLGNSQNPVETTYWDILTSGFKWLSTWNNIADYGPGHVVKYGGKIYVATDSIFYDNANPNTPPTIDSSRWELLVDGFNWRGEYSSASNYAPGDIVRLGGRTYLCTEGYENDGSTTPEPPNTDYWEVFTDGFKWRGAWDIATEYEINDVVEYAQSSYIGQTADNVGTTPGTNPSVWQLVAQGDSNAVMTTEGDIIFRDGTGATRLPIGPSGSFLTVQNGQPSWGHLTPQNDYYVSPQGDDTNDGRTPTTSWKTIRHAADSTFNLGQCRINVQAGTYSEQCPIKVGRSVVLEGNGLGAVTVSPDTTNDNGFGVGISDDGSTPNANSDVFHMNNGCRMRNFVFRNFSTGSVIVSLDPGTGPDDTSVWITSQSPYVQNCTSFTPGGTGFKIDGGLHNGGYKSMVANDWTQINSDGVGIHVLNDGRSEIVSCFTYYCNIGYLAESGGKIRAIVGNNSYGEYGAVARGFSQSETPLTGNLQLTDETINSVTQLLSDVHVFTSYRDSVGNRIFVGHTNPSGTDVTSSWDNTASYPFICKFNSAGSLDWIYTYESSFGAIHSVVEVSDRYYAGGVIYDAATNKGFVLAISKAGEIQWQKIIGDTSEITDVTTDNNNLYAIGTHTSTGSAIIKLNPAGVEQWSRTLEYNDSSAANTLVASSACAAVTPTTSIDTYANAGDATAEGNLYVASFDSTANQSVITRFTSAGVYVASYIYGDVRINKLRLDSGNGDGIYLVAAGYYDAGAVNKNPIAFRINVKGDVAWQKQLALSSEEGEWKDVLPFGNDIYLTGYMNEGTNNNNTGLIARYTSTGNSTWTQIFDNGTNNVALNGVMLDGVNVISAGIENTNSIILNVQRDIASGLGSVTSGSYNFASIAGETLTNNTVVQKNIEETTATSLTLGTTDSTLTLNQSPSQTRTVVATRQGFAGIGTGVLFTVSGLSRSPKEGSVLQIAGDTETYFVIGVNNFDEGTGIGGVQIDPAIPSNKTPNDNTAVTFREAYSQVRMSGHDFLDIGTGGFADTNYPVIIQADYTQQPDQTRETLSENGGRVFYVTTDQDGNFRVGDYFKVEQATGRATLSSEEFDLSGLNELQLGSITAGRQGATVNEFSTDGTFADNSDQAVPTEKAVKTYVDQEINNLSASQGTIVAGNSPTQSKVEVTGSGASTDTIDFDIAGSQVAQIGSEYLQLPAGTTGNRPGTPASGMFRYNTTTNSLEVYGSTSWEPAGSIKWAIVNTATAITKGEGFMCDTTGGGFIVTLPAAPALGDAVRIMDLAGTFDTDNLVIARNGNNIMGLAQDLTLSTENAAIGLVYSNATYGWKLIEVL